MSLLTARTQQQTNPTPLDTSEVGRPQSIATRRRQARPAHAGALARAQVSSTSCVAFATGSVEANVLQQIVDRTQDLAGAMELLMSRRGECTPAGFQILVARWVEMSLIACDDACDVVLRDDFFRYDNLPVEALKRFRPHSMAMSASSLTADDRAELSQSGSKLWVLQFSGSKLTMDEVDICDLENINVERNVVVQLNFPVVADTLGMCSNISGGICDAASYVAADAGAKEKWRCQTGESAVR